VRRDYIQPQRGRDRLMEMGERGPVLTRRKHVRTRAVNVKMAFARAAGAFGGP